MEPRLLQSQRRGDIEVMNPSAPSNIHSYAQGTLLEHSEDTKRKNYRHIQGINVNSINSFIPFVLSVGGELSSSATQLINLLVKKAKNEDLGDDNAPPMHKRWWLARLAGRLLHALTNQRQSYNIATCQIQPQNQRSLCCVSHGVDPNEEHPAFLDQLESEQILPPALV